MAEKIEKIEAFVYRKLRDHLQNNAGVQNIDIMNLTGFCRNCLSKWYYVGASKLGHKMTYEEACEAVYTMPYKTWKSKYQKKASEEQLEKFLNDKSLHAVHPKLDDVALEMEKMSQPLAQNNETVGSGPVMSDVCCEDPEISLSSTSNVLEKACQGRIRIKSPMASARIPEFKLGVLTVSDRAFAGTYDDLSGPEVEKLCQGYGEKTKDFALTGVFKHIVPDEVDQISAKLIELSDSHKCSVIITTGGTGLSKRDVTPEATKAVVNRIVQGIPEAIRRETSKVEPLAMLSRAVAGIRNDQTLIVNLPGRPKAVRESMVVLLPVLAQAVSQLQRES